jgi:hypothetical protein
MCLPWGKIVGAGFHHHFVGQQPAKVDQKVLGWVIVGLDVGMRERRARVFCRVANFLAKFSVHPQKLAERGS